MHYILWYTIIRQIGSKKASIVVASKSRNRAKKYRGTSIFKGNITNQNGEGLISEYQSGNSSAFVGGSWNIESVCEQNDCIHRNAFGEHFFVLFDTHPPYFVIICKSFPHIDILPTQFFLLFSPWNRVTRCDVLPTWKHEQRRQYCFNNNLASKDYQTYFNRIFLFPF